MSCCLIGFSLTLGGNGVKIFLDSLTHHGGKGKENGVSTSISYLRILL